MTLASNMKMMKKEGNRSGHEMENADKDLPQDRREKKTDGGGVA
jgi:hypothetical protein